ncbi:hypothetical protein CIT292_08879 [Citrobacter youngae ATCC 29220]|uniref:Uncharacterized protein n=1 Tax=Citrobacter youngae ATCC 29220 TaxID=500640 RepID=D4BEE6_9ENTR|nr:hypothetical protein CIT292_08879 [Citrobacter youngae ATCC 29220]
MMIANMRQMAAIVKRLTACVIFKLVWSEGSLPTIKNNED